MTEVQPRVVPGGVSEAVPEDGMLRAAPVTPPCPAPPPPPALPENSRATVFMSLCIL